MMTGLAIFLGIVLIKFVINISKYRRCKKFYTMYKNWLKDKSDTIFEYKSEIITLFKSAHIQDHLISYAEPVGYGYISSGQVSTFMNFPHRSQDMVASTARMFTEAIGFYRSRAFESFNPVYWIETLVFLPKRLVTYLGFSGETLGAKILNLLWWIFTVGGGALLAIYRPDIGTYIKDLVNKIFP